MMHDHSFTPFRFLAQWDENRIRWIIFIYALKAFSTAYLYFLENVKWNAQLH